MRTVAVIVCGLCAAALITLYIVFSFIPDQRRIADAAHIERAVTREVDRLEAVSGGLPAIREEYARAEAGWVAASGFLVPRDSVPDFVAWFRNAPGRSGLDGGWEWGTIEGRDCYRFMPFRLRGTGSSGALRKMLARWEARPNGWGVSQMTVFWEDSGHIRATFTGALYFQNLD